MTLFEDVPGQIEQRHLSCNQHQKTHLLEVMHLIQQQNARHGRNTPPKAAYNRVKIYKSRTIIYSILPLGAPVATYIIALIPTFVTTQSLRFDKTVRPLNEMFHQNEMNKVSSKPQMMNTIRSVSRTRLNKSSPSLSQMLPARRCTFTKSHFFGG